MESSERWRRPLLISKRHAARLAAQSEAACDFDDPPVLLVRAAEAEEETEEEEEVEIELPCPYCFEELGFPLLCAHLDLEHYSETCSAVCPICSDEVTRDMLHHITSEHSELFKTFLGRYHIPSQADFASVRRSGLRSTSKDTTDRSADSLLLSLGLEFSTDVEDNQNASTSTGNDASKVEEHQANSWHLSSSSTLTDEERAQKSKEARVRATFVQDLLLSTLFAD